MRPGVFAKGRVSQLMFKLYMSEALGVCTKIYDENETF